LIWDLRMLETLKPSFVILAETFDFNESFEHDKTLVLRENFGSIGNFCSPSNFCT
jgi:hypothetical protein